MEKGYSDEEILKLKKIAKIIINRKRHNVLLNRYDYYIMGGIPFRKGEKTLYAMYKDNKLTKLEFNILYNYIENEMFIGASRNKEFILKTHYQFGNVVISDEVKQNIWRALNSLGLDDGDIDDLVFAGAVRAYAKENELIPSKILVRKK